MTYLLRCCLPGLLLLCASTAAAADQTRTPIDVDVFRGPVIASSRILGLAGAYTAIAEGTQGGFLNPASFINRYPYSTDWFDWDWNYDLMLLEPGAEVDMFNTGEASHSANEYRAQNVGIGLQFGKFGIGVSFNNNHFKVAGRNGEYHYGFDYGYLGLAYAFLEEQLLLGMGIGTGSLVLSDKEDRNELVKWENSGLDVGLVWRPDDESYRLGVSFRRPVSIRPDLEETAVPEEVKDLTIPDNIAVPWRLALGAAYKFGASGRPFNCGREDREREMELLARSGLSQVLDRRYVLVAVDLLIYGAAPEGSTGMTSFLAGDSVPSGESASYSIHAGVESEVMNNFLLVRGGTYLEPTRVESSSYRPHLTLGTDVRVGEFLWWEWKAGIGLDFAPRYHNTIISLGFWH